MNGTDEEKMQESADKDHKRQDSTPGPADGSRPKETTPKSLWEQLQASGKQYNKSTLTFDKLKEVIGDLYAKKVQDPDPTRRPNYWTPKYLGNGMWQMGPMITNEAGLKEFDDAVKRQAQEYLDGKHKPKHNGKE